MSNNKKKNKKVSNKDTENKKKRTASNLDVDNEKTKKVKIPNNKRKKAKGEKTKKPHPKLKLALKILGILILIGILAIAGVVAGVFFGLFGDDFTITKEDLIISTSNSVALDKDENVIATLAGDEKREIVTLSDMPSYLPEAFISIEDERFREHKGVDIQRTAYAAVKYVLNGGSSSFGGSTITQQLVKNITKDKEDSGIAGIIRKLKEWVKAYKIEEIASKDQILETYLNILSMGGGSKNIHGVQLGAKYYFNKEVKDLSIEECAYLAGINHAPNTYNPFKEGDEDAKNAKSEKIKKRTKTVLAKMYELNKISKEEYDNAVSKVNEGLNFEQGTITESVYSYHTDAMITEVVEELAEKNGWDKDFAETKLKSGGYIIYTTQDTALQKRMEEEFAKSKYLMASKNYPDEHTEAAMAVVQNNTGYVVGVVGRLGEKTARGYNIATQGGKQTGSAMKPLSAIAPALEANLITAGTVFDDAPTTFKGMNKDWPKNYDNTFKGLMTVRYTIEISHNVGPVAIVSELGPEKAVKFLKDMNFKSVDPSKDANLSIALGGLTVGATPLEMAAGYSMIANGGEYIEPTFFTKVVDSKGNVVLETKQERKRMMSESNAYILQSILFQVVTGSSGTARYCAIKGMDVGAKTGTTNSDYDRWLCGFTPYYAAATWYGYEKHSETIRYRGNPSNPAGSIWDAVMEFAHKDLESKRFKVPDNIKKVTICKDSGMLAGDYCNEDPRGTRTYTEVYVSGTEPTEKCTVHTKAKICEVDGTVKLANDNCPNPVERVFITRKDSDKYDSWRKTADASYMLPTETCTTHTKKEEPVNNTTNTINNNTTNATNNTTNSTNNTKNNTTNNSTNNNTNTNTNTNTSTNTTNNSTTNNTSSNTVPPNENKNNTGVDNAIKNAINEISGNN